MQFISLSSFNNSWRENTFLIIIYIKSIINLLPPRSKAKNDLICIFQFRKHIKENVAKFEPLNVQHTPHGSQEWKCFTIFLWRKNKDLEKYQENLWYLGSKIVLKNHKSTTNGSPDKTQPNINIFYFPPFMIFQSFTYKVYFNANC